MDDVDTIDTNHKSKKICRIYYSKIIKSSSSNYNNNFTLPRSTQPIQLIQPIRPIQQIQPIQPIQSIQLPIQPKHTQQQIQPFIQHIQSNQSIQHIQSNQPIQDIKEIQSIKSIQHIKELQQFKHKRKQQLTQQIQTLQNKSTNKRTYPVDINKSDRQRRIDIPNINELSNNVMYNSTDTECDNTSENSIISENLDEAIIVDDNKDLLIFNTKQEINKFKDNMYYKLTEDFHVPWTQDEHITNLF
jgi:hypothetical protein